MKYLISLAFLLCSYIAYGQDLIVTTTGDSLKCKIVEVGADEIQFRFNTDGNVVSIKRSETASYKYNFVPASEKASVGNKNAPVKQADPIYDTSKNTERKEKKAQSEGDYSKFYAGLVGGAPLLLGLNAAYFLNHHVGFGFAVHYQEVDLGSRYMQGTFFGPVFYGHWGRRNGKFFFPTNIGIGVISYYEEYSYSGSYYYPESGTTFGVFFSGGIAYRPTKLISIGLNLELVSDIDFYYGLSAFTLGLNFHF